jgi:hypothetical protein
MLGPRNSMPVRGGAMSQILDTVDQNAKLHL